MVQLMKMVIGACLVLGVFLVEGAAAAADKPSVIIDTDLGSSIDDLFALDFAARMHREGKLDLMAVMMDRPDGSDPDGEGEFLDFADRYLNSLGLGEDFPLGKSESLTDPQSRPEVINPYWTLATSNEVTDAWFKGSGRDLTEVPDAVELYRSLLETAPGKSVVICSIGFFNNLRALLESDPELIAAKVKELRIMGGCFDGSVVRDCGVKGEYNVMGDIPSATKIFAEWPTPIVVTPWEVGTKLEYRPEDVLKDFPVGTLSPTIRAVYERWPNPPEGYIDRLWDPMTLFPLTEGETFAPLSEKGGIEVDAEGATTFTPNASSNRCYQVASNMNATAVMNRLREICREGNPSVTMLVSGKPEPGVDYNGSELVFRFENIQLGSFSEEDLGFSFAIDGAEYAPESSEWDETLGAVNVRFVIPPDAVTAGNAYDGTLTVKLENDRLGSVQLMTASRRLVQGRSVQTGQETDWFDETNLGAPTNFVPMTQMPDGCRATVEMDFDFDTTDFFMLVGGFSYVEGGVLRIPTGTVVGASWNSPSPQSAEPKEYPPDAAFFQACCCSPLGAVQGAVRIVSDGAFGYKFQYYACVGKPDGDGFVRGWWDFNAEGAQEIKPLPGGSYTVRVEADYFEDVRGGEDTLVISVGEAGSSQGPVKQFVGKLVDDYGGVGGTTRLNSVGFIGDGEISSLVGNYCISSVNSNLAEIDGTEYASVAEAVAVANGKTVRLLHAASWSPSPSDFGKPVSFLNKSDLVLDLSDLPANARAVWTDVDGDNGTLTLELVYADTVVYGTIRTADEGNPVAEAIAIKDGKYVSVGDATSVAAYVKDGVTEVIDHRGKGMVMPGCTDGHSHYLNTFAMKHMKGGVLFDIWDDKDAVLQKLSEATRKASDAGKKSLCGFGWNPQIFLSNKLSLADLDGVTHGVSTVIFDSSGHHAFCNTECLKRCKILGEDGKTVLIEEIDGGLLELDENKYPTGYVNERVTGYLTRMGGIDADELIDDEVAEDAILKSQELLLSTGYTAALDAWSNQMHSNRFYEAAHRMDTNGTLKLVLPMTYEVEPWQTDMLGEIDYLVSLNETYRTAHVLPEYLKVFMDGVVESRTGATIKPYRNGTTYKSFWSVARLAEITEKCNARGLTVHAHTMGDAAIRDVTDAYLLGGDGTHRNCLVHLRNVREEDFQRMADNNIACAVGLTWHVMDTDFDSILKQFLCDEYVEHAYPIKSFLDAGVRASGHSDYPANIPSPQDPFGMMQVAVTGMVPDPGECDYQYDANELITVEQAFQMLTLNGAWQLGLENERGSIAVGKWADFVLADQDVFTCATNEIGKTRVVSTWFEGEKVYPESESVPVKPGESIVRDTAEEASNVLKRAEFTPSAEVAERLGGEESTALQTYCNMFALDVVPAAGGAWAVEAGLTPEAWTSVVLSAQAATRQLPVARIAEWQFGDDPISVLLTNCVPGFYYSLYQGVTLTNFTAAMEANGNVLCGTDREVVLPEVTKPIGGRDSGFFTIGALEIPTLYIPGADYTMTGKVPCVHPSRMSIRAMPEE